MPFDSREFEYADTSVQVLGTELTGLRGLKYKHSQEKEHVYGKGNQPKAIQRGNKKGEGQLLLLKSDYDLLDRAAIAAGYEGIVDVPGDLIILTCVYQKPGLTTLSVDTLFGVEFTEAEDGMNQNDKFKEVTLPFLYLRKKKV